MVVDDDPIFRMLVKRVAEQLGRAQDLLLCANLAEAWQRVYHKPLPDDVKGVMQ